MTDPERFDLSDANLHRLSGQPDARLAFAAGLAYAVEHMVTLLEACDCGDCAGYRHFALGCRQWAASELAALEGRPPM